MTADTEAIEQALYRYARALDRKEWALLDGVFAADVVTDYGVGPPVAGRDAVVANIRRNLERCRAQHLFGNVSVEVRGEAAECTAAIRAMHVAEIDGQDRTLEAIGDYIVQWRATSEGWRATHVKLTVTANIGDRRVLAAHFKD
ncbi:MAG TPA: nuclear transport factor 2 family protein [Alphaproteobacteria bacterium]|nr:nuclear transport factor 2 family protein [Alphaproteobacteria bacterium]